MSAVISRTSATFAWQGWQLVLPSRWNPVKLEGNYENGYALIADMNRPQLGVRWRTMAAKRFDPQRALRGEVGALAAEKAKTFDLSGENWTRSTLFLEPEPPGRDVWVGHSRVSGRAIEIVHQVRRRDRVLEDSILPTLADTRPDEARPWAVFDLACIVPAGFELVTHTLNAGDLSLHFACKRQTLTVRQIALAGMALNRMPLEKWLVQQERAVAKHYRATGAIEDASPGILRISKRRRRFGWMRWLPEWAVTYAVHDEERDRLILLQGNDDAMLREVARTVGG